MPPGALDEAKKYLSKLEEVLQCLWVSVEGVTVSAVSVSPGLAPPRLQQPAHADLLINQLITILTY